MSFSESGLSAKRSFFFQSKGRSKNFNFYNTMAYKISNDCIACGTCIDECPLGAIHEGDEHYSIDPEVCAECGTCADVCPTGAISL